MWLGCRVFLHSVRHTSAVINTRQADARISSQIQRRDLLCALGDEGPPLPESMLGRHHMPADAIALSWRFWPPPNSQPGCNLQGFKHAYCDRCMQLGPRERRHVVQYTADSKQEHCVMHAHGLVRGAFRTITCSRQCSKRAMVEYSEHLYI